jgi:hypothetical protein
MPLLVQNCEEQYKDVRFEWIQNAAISLYSGRDVYKLG